jgi:hypothetical protein
LIGRAGAGFGFRTMIGKFFRISAAFGFIRCSTQRRSGGTAQQSGKAGSSCVHRSLASFAAAMRSSVAHHWQILQDFCGCWVCLAFQPCSRRGLAWPGLGSTGRGWSSAPARNTCRHPGRGGVSRIGQSDTLTDFRDTRPISARDASSEDTRTGTRVPRRQRRPSPIRRVCGKTHANSISDYRNFLKPGRGGMRVMPLSRRLP